MRVRDLGALVVDAGTHEQPVSGTRGAAMLALLTMNANQRVSVDALMNAAWGESITAGAASTLESHIWRLRRLVEPARDRRQAPTVLINDAGGYRLLGGPSSIDSLSLAESAADARDVLAAGHAADAVRAADEGLALWRGDPYGGFGDADWARPTVAGLRELRDQLQERRIDALLAVGALDEVLTDVQPLLDRLPFRESLRELQLQALYLTGRREQALQSYQDARRLLRDEVGIEPGPRLRELHGRILRDDPGLVRIRPVAVAGRRTEVRLPPVMTPTVGRDADVADLTRLVSQNRVVTIIGAAGCGKTRLAVDVARVAAPAFPDGVWLVDLTAVADPSLVTDVIASTIGLSASSGATPLQDLRRYLQTRRILLVLDNCEHVLEGVDGVVRVAVGDATPGLGCCILSTSRSPIGIEGEFIWMLQPLAVPDTETLETAGIPSVDLFLQQLSRVAPRLIVDEAALTTVAQICIAVDGLPLALELAASRALSHSLGDIAAQVVEDPSRLGRLGRASPPDHRATVRSAIQWSRRLLSPHQQAAHRRISVLPGLFTSRVAAAVMGEADVAAVDEVLAELVHRSLVSAEGAVRGRPSGFRQLATVRGHARYALADADETALCEDRRDDWGTHLLDRRPALGTAREADWYREIDDDYAAIRATLTRQLIDEPRPAGGRLASRLTYYWYYRQRMVEATRWLQLGCDALRGERSTDELIARIGLAAALASQGRVDAARTHLDNLDYRVRTAPGGRLVDVGEALVGLATSAWIRDAHDLTAAAHGLLSWIVSEAPDSNLALLVDAVGCLATFGTGHPDAAVSLAEDVTRRALVADNPMAAWVATSPPMVAALLESAPGRGIPWVNRCMTEHLRLGVGAAGMFIETRANYAAQLGHFAEAAGLYAAARTQTRRAAMVWPRRSLTLELLALTQSQLSASDFATAWQLGEHLTMADVVHTD